MRWEWRASGETTLMIREEYIKLIEELETTRREADTYHQVTFPGYLQRMDFLLFLLNPFHSICLSTGGPGGAGKSLLAAYVYDYAIKNGWLAVYIPSGAFPHYFLDLLNFTV